MTLGSSVPRPEQIDVLTRGIELPLTALHEEHLSLIADIVALAWDDLASNQAGTLATGSEAEINALLEASLSRLLDEDPLWAQLVLAVARGKETVNFDGAHLEKRPDLSIFLSGRSPAFPLVVECKLIDAPDGKSGTLYCNNGLRRFLTGEYGWSGRDGFMLAYVRDQSTIESCLLPILAVGRTSNPDPFAVRDWPAERSHVALDLATTRHNRAFRYLNRVAPADEPGPIAICHLWLPTSAGDSSTNASDGSGPRPDTYAHV
ncbi:hypothetical protein NM680_17740 [Paracoccus sp. PS-1]|uniref:hypothetical protein n=1 Tax=Paracoccus sp. PS1 TaxID=2963938 RepID=UPI0027E4B427|nr:hypothetical protein [Paracoccus sp. PS1]MDQ7263644.1 hypothetical protein [Paracoccus sp. PS1]